MKNSMLNKVLSIVVNWNGKEYLEGCILSLQKSKGIVIDILVVDNASSDNSLSILNKYPKVIVIQNSENVGYGAAVNQGIKWASNREYQYAFIMNPDMVVCANAISKMMDELARDSNTIIIGPELLSMRDPTKTHYGKRPPSKSGAEYVNWLCGGAMLVSVDKWLRIGGFDERYFLYKEESDLFYRINKAGYKMKISHEAVTYHHLGETGKNKKHSSLPVYYTTRNFWLFAKKNLRGLELMQYIIKKEISKLLIPGLYLPKNLIAFLHGNLDGIFNKFGKCDLYFKFSDQQNNKI